MSESFEQQVMQNYPQYSGMKNFVSTDDTSIKVNDNVNHPTHYCSHPSGVECIDITRHYCFSIGNAIKYLWRAGIKTENGMAPINKEIEDLKKAIWYITDRIKYLENKQSKVEKYGEKK